MLVGAAATGARPALVLGRPVLVSSLAFVPGAFAAADAPEPVVLARLVGLFVGERGVLAVAYGAGDTQWFNLIVAPLAASRGYTLWSFQDVTARHTMEQMLRDERMKLADFLDNAPIGFYSVDQVGRFLFVNEALAH